jgi:hypothetical protein
MYLVVNDSTEPIVSEVIINYCTTTLLMVTLCGCLWTVQWPRPLHVGASEGEREEREKEREVRGKGRERDKDSQR